MPAIIPAPGTSPWYRSHAASWPISRNGEPGSSNRSTRSRGSSLPRATWRSRCFSLPPLRLRRRPRATFPRARGCARRGHGTRRCPVGSCCRCAARSCPSPHPVGRKALCRSPSAAARLQSGRRNRPRPLEEENRHETSGFCCSRPRSRSPPATRSKATPTRPPSRPGHRDRHRPRRDGQVGQAGRRLLHYANGNWVKNTEIPADRSNIGGFYIADQEREKNTKELIDAILKANAAADTNEAGSPITTRPISTPRDRPRRPGAAQGRPRRDRRDRRQARS